MQRAPLQPLPSIDAASATGYCVVDDHGALVAADDRVRGWLSEYHEIGACGVHDLLVRAESQETTGAQLPQAEGPLAVPLEGPFEGVLAVGDHQGEAVRGVARRLAGSAGPLSLLALQLSSAEEVRFADPLTGLPDRREIAARIDAWRRREPDVRFALLFVDLDDFKQINDCHGHLVGDRVLQELAQRWQHGVREGDLVARYGGDEFVILLKDARDRHEVQLIVERLQRETAAPLRINGLPVRISASVGVAIAAPVQSLSDLIGRADGDLYQAKRRRPR